MARPLGPLYQNHLEKLAQQTRLDLESEIRRQADQQALNHQIEVRYWVKVDPTQEASSLCLISSNKGLLPSNSAVPVLVDVKHGINHNRNPDDIPFFSTLRRSRHERTSGP